MKPMKRFAIGFLSTVTLIVGTGCGCGEQELVDLRLLRDRGGDSLIQADLKPPCDAGVDHLPGPDLKLPTCSINNIQDGAETDIDCGGAVTGCPRCAEGQKCGGDYDCKDGLICDKSSHTCEVPALACNVSGNQADDLPADTTIEAFECLASAQNGQWIVDGTTQTIEVNRYGDPGACATITITSNTLGSTFVCVGQRCYQDCNASGKRCVIGTFDSTCTHSDFIDAATGRLLATADKK